MSSFSGALHARTSNCLEQGPPRRAEAAPQAEGDLVPRIRLQLATKTRDLALFNLGLDSKLRGCDLVSLRVRDVYQGATVATRAIVMQRKTQRPVQFEITEATRESVAAWVARATAPARGAPVPGPRRGPASLGAPVQPHPQEVGAFSGTRSCPLWHALTSAHQATLIYKRTKNIRAIQLLLGHTKLESTVRYLGLEVNDALEISEQTEI